MGGSPHRWDFSRVGAIFVFVVVAEGDWVLFLLLGEALQFFSQVLFAFFHLFLFAFEFLHFLSNFTIFNPHPQDRDFQQIGCIWSVLGVDRQHPSDHFHQVLGISTGYSLEVAILYVGSELVVVYSDKRSLEGCHFIYNTAHRPDIRFFIISRFLADLFRRHVVGSSNVGLGELRVLP